MAFETITAPKTERELGRYISFTKSAVHIGPALYEEMKLKQYPYVTFAWDKDARKLAILRGATKGANKFKVDANGQVNNARFVDEIRQVTDIDAEGVLRYDYTIDVIRGVIAAVIDVDLDII